MSFKGEHYNKIDAKGRLIIPAKFREDLDEEFVVTKGLDHCLFVYPQSAWTDIENKLQEIPLTGKDARKFTRFFFGSASNCEVDKQGRILVPPSLREYAGLQKDVALVGVLHRIEIWDKERWLANEYDDDDMDVAAEHMADLGVKI